MKKPNINVNFHVFNENIKKITLEPGNGLTYQIVGKGLERLISEWMNQYSSGKTPNIDLPLDMNSLPPYAFIVLKTLQKIPFGSFLSYQELAVKTGKPKAARAVGNSCGRNPFPLVIPCHRVLAGNQKIGGFSLDLNIKKNLLDFEGISFRA